MTKKLIIMAAVGVVSFAGAFVLAWLTYSSAPNPAETPEQRPVADGRPERETAPPELALADGGDAGSGPMGKAMTQQQLKNLIQDIREKMREYDNRLQALTVRERRFQMAQDMLKEDIEKLNSLRTELASTVASLKTERDKLLKSRLEIDQAERVNLSLIAAAYDKMEAASAGKILTNMCATVGDESQGTKRDGSFDDAAKILYYMTDRTKANVLAELAISEPALAAAFSQRLKQIVEGT